MVLPSFALPQGHCILPAYLILFCKERRLPFLKVLPASFLPFVLLLFHFFHRNSLRIFSRISRSTNSEHGYPTSTGSDDIAQDIGSRALAVRDCDRGGAFGSATGTFTILIRNPNIRYYTILLRHTKKSPEKIVDVVDWAPEPS